MEGLDGCTLKTMQCIENPHTSETDRLTGNDCLKATFCTESASWQHMLRPDSEIPLYSATQVKIIRMKVLVCRFFTLRSFYQSASESFPKIINVKYEGRNKFVN